MGGVRGVCKGMRETERLDRRNLRKKFAAVKNHLKEFRDELSFDTFTENGLNDYVDFLRNKKDMRNSTIGKQIAFLKWFLRWSFKKGYNQNMAYDSFKPKPKNTPKK